MSTNNNPISLRIVRFWTDYTRKNEDGTPRAVDMVEYCGVGMAQSRTTIATVSSLSRVRPFEMGSEDVAAAMANERWTLIKGAYDAWKKGEEIPDRGTPLGAWPGITQEQAALIRQAGLRSVEEMAEANDTILKSIKLPNTLGLKENAKRYLASFDKQATAMKIEAAEKRSEGLEQQLEDMRQIVLEMQAKTKAAEEKANDKPKEKAKAA